MERVKFTIEFIFKASPAILYNLLTTPSGLTRWFCDEVDINKKVYTFSWNGAEEVATVVEDIEDEMIQFHWEDAEEENEVLEFKMSRSPVTGETIMEITDFCDADEIEDQKELWNTQMQNMKSASGG